MLAECLPVFGVLLPRKAGQNKYDSTDNNNVQVGNVNPDCPFSFLTEMLKSKALPFLFFN